MNKEMTSMAIQPILDIGLAKCAAFLKGAKKPFLVVLLVASLVTFLPQCSSGGGSDVGGNGSGDGNGNGSGDGNGNGGGDGNGNGNGDGGGNGNGDGGGNSCTPDSGTTEPIAVLYDQGTHNGSFDGKGFGICNEANAPAILKASKCYTGHTFYGSTTDSENRDFNKLPDRLGGTSPGARKMRVLHGTTLHTPSEQITLSELIAPGNNGSYANSEGRRVFRLIANGNETATNTSYNYWSFSDGTGAFSMHNCGGANGGDSSYTGVYGTYSATIQHGTAAEQSTLTSSGTVGCDNTYNVLCLARKN